MIFKKHTCTWTVVLPVFYQVYYNISQIWNRNTQAGGGSLTFEICMGGALAVVGKNPGKRDMGQNIMLSVECMSGLFGIQLYL